MNGTTLFSMVLGLQAPWQVNDVTFSANTSYRKELHLHIGFAQDSRFLDKTGTVVTTPNDLSKSSVTCILVALRVAAQVFVEIEWILKEITQLLAQTKKICSLWRDR